ncbi:MAG: FAD-binding oxidoreductase [Saprospiraceae bacterium]|nr:FAD-binding oxidoreductase [Saprospiraceae bacterium]
MIIDELIEKLGPDRVLIGEDVKERYTHIWKMDQGLDAVAVLLPRSTEELSKAMSVCHKYGQTVNVHGGLTNLVGATETSENEVVISLEKMNQIEEVDDTSRTITVQAGVKLEEVQNAAKDYGLLFPLNFGAKGSAHMGGVISTNAGGLRVVRYGMTRALVLGIEAVLADGTIVNSLKKVIKDNSAYDLKHLFVGSEGTLGIITRAVLKLVESPKSRNSAFVAFNDFSKVVEFLKFMDGGLAGTMSGFELIWHDCYVAMTSAPATMRPPLPQDYKYYVLIESLGGDQDTDRERMQSLLEEAVEKEMILDAAMALNESDLNWFWTIREDVHVFVSKCTVDQHFDISMPLVHIGPVVDDILDKLKDIPNVEQEHRFVFGHVADGNVHLVIGKDTDDPKVTLAVNDVIYSPLKALGGSVSAEHGIGTHKKAYLPLCRSEEEITLMKTLKKSMDPKGILNPGRVFDI